MGGNGCHEVANTRPLFLAIYATVIIGVVFSSFYVFSAISSAKSAADSNTSWLSFPSPFIASMFIISQLLFSLYYLLAFCYQYIFSVTHTHLNRRAANTNFLLNILNFMDNRIPIFLGLDVFRRFSCTVNDFADMLW